MKIRSRAFYVSLLSAAMWLIATAVVVAEGAADNESTEASMKFIAAGIAMGVGLSGICRSRKRKILTILSLMRMNQKRRVLI